MMGIDEKDVRVIEEEKADKSKKEWNAEMNRKRERNKK